MLNIAVKNNVVSIFPSIDGECNIYGQGHLTTFVRLSGCNLKDNPCSFCDTRWATESTDENTVHMDYLDVFRSIRDIGLKKVTITGGEPLMQQEELLELCKILDIMDYKVTIETNGTIAPCSEFKTYGVNFIYDWKLPSSGVDKYNRYGYTGLYSNVTDRDYVKFVIADDRDFQEAVMRVKMLGPHRTNFAFSCVNGIAGVATEKWLIRRMIETKMDGILNVQLHKLLNLQEDGHQSITSY